MSEEILKVLEKLKNKSNYQRDCNDGSCFIELFVNEIYILCKFMEDLQQKVEQQEKEIERLNNIIDTMLEFSFFKEECPLNFGFADEKEEKAQDVIYEDDYCEGNCNDIYKKCWLKYFEKLQKLKENK